jgi:hypothetical protein
MAKQRLERQNCLTDALDLPLLQRRGGNDKVIQVWKLKACVYGHRSLHLQGTCPVNRHQPSITEYTTVISLIGVILIIAAYMWLVYTRALNLPGNDDLQDILFFVVKLSNADTLSNAWTIFFDQHADHKTAASRLFYWLVYKAQDEVNFRTLAVVVQAAVVATTYVLYRQVGDLPDKYMALLLIVFCLFHPRAYTILIWPMAAIGFFNVILYGIVALYLLGTPRPAHFWGAVITAVMGTFTFTPGLLIWPLGLVILLSRENPRSPPQFVYTASWIAAAFITITIFRYDYTIISIPLSTSLDSFLNHPVYTFQFFLALVGSGLSYGNVVVAQLVGFAILIGVLLMSYSGIRSGLASIHYFVWYVVLTIALITVGRAPVGQLDIFGDPMLLDLALTARYGYPSMVLTACLVTSWIRTQPNRKLVIALVGVLGVMCAGNYSVYTKALDKQREARIDWYNDHGVVPWHGEEAEVLQMVEAAEVKGIYRLPVRPITY